MRITVGPGRHRDWHAHSDSVQVVACPFVGALRWACSKEAHGHGADMGGGVSLSSDWAFLLCFLLFHNMS